MRCVAAGSWPVWNPYPALGHPLLAVPNNETLYPFTWLNLLVQPGPYMTAFAAVHLLVGALGAYAFARRVSLSPLAAGASGLLWCASGPLLSLVNGWNHLHALRHVARKAGARDRARFAGLAVLAVVFAIGLSAAQWLPTFELARHSARARLDPATRTYWSVHPALALAGGAALARGKGGLWKRDSLPAGSSGRGPGARLAPRRGAGVAERARLLTC